MADQQPTEQELQALYQAADDLKAVAPWEWLYDSDIFALRDPATDEVHYCCVMGNLGEHLALALYIGRDGLAGFQKIQSGELNQTDPAAVILGQHCLMISFEDREFLDKRDRDEIKSLGRRYRGRQAWPQFRNYTPGLFPWHLSADEVQLLTIAIEQTLDVARHARDGELELGFAADGSLLLREQIDGNWQDSRYTPSLNIKKAQPVEVPPVDELRLARLRRAKLARTGTWEADTFTLPEPVQNGRNERPYFPIACLFVDGPTGMVLAPHIAGPDDWPTELQQLFLRLVEQQQVLPKQVVVRSAEIRDLLKPAVEGVGSTVRIVKRLPALEEARASLLSYMGR